MPVVKLPTDVDLRRRRRRRQRAHVELAALLPFRSVRVKVVERELAFLESVLQTLGSLHRISDQKFFEEKVIKIYFVQSQNYEPVNKLEYQSQVTVWR